MACSRPANTFTTLGGVPVHYDRLDPPHHYGSKGKPYSFAAQQSMEDLLDGALTELWSKCPLGKADIILSAGAFVCKSGQHGRGNSFDLDGIWWGDRLLLTKNYRTESKAYLGVEAILRKYFGTVLNFEYNRSHQDHWHVDTGTKPGFGASSRSRVLFLQMALSKLFGQKVSVDGRVGDETRGAARDLLQSLGVASAAEMTSSSGTDSALARNWNAFLDEAARRGLSTLGPAVTGTGGDPGPHAASPLALLSRLHEHIDDELVEHPARKTIECALENLVESPEIAAVLSRFESGGGDEGSPQGSVMRLPLPGGGGFSGSTYVVVRGDSLSRIARNFNVTLQDLIAANPQIVNPDLIEVGQRLNLPVVASDSGVHAPTGPVGSFNAADLDVLAKTIFGEAEGESVKGQEAVGWVVRNRVDARSWWGRDIIGVCKHPAQFSCWNNGNPRLPILNSMTASDSRLAGCMEVARRVLTGEALNPVGDATHYHALSVNPAWAETGRLVTRIGGHLFYADID